MLTDLLHCITQPHYVGRLSTGLCFRRVKHDIQVSHIGELKMNFLIGVNKVLDLSHCKLSVAKKLSNQYIRNQNETDNK